MGGPRQRDGAATVKGGSCAPTSSDRRGWASDRPDCAQAGVPWYKGKTKSTDKGVGKDKAELTDIQDIPPWKRGWSKAEKKKRAAAAKAAPQPSRKKTPRGYRDPLTVSLKKTRRRARKLLETSKIVGRAEDPQQKPTRSKGVNLQRTSNPAATASAALKRKLAERVEENLNRPDEVDEFTSSEEEVEVETSDSEAARRTAPIRQEQPKARSAPQASSLIELAKRRRAVSLAEAAKKDEDKKRAKEASAAADTAAPKEPERPKVAAEKVAPRNAERLKTSSVQTGERPRARPRITIHRPGEPSVKLEPQVPNATSAATGVRTTRPDTEAGRQSRGSAAATAATSGLEERKGATEQDRTNRPAKTAAEAKVEKESAEAQTTSRSELPSRTPEQEARLEASRQKIRDLKASRDSIERDRPQGFAKQADRDRVSETQGAAASQVARENPAPSRTVRTQGSAIDRIATLDRADRNEQLRRRSVTVEPNRTLRGWSEAPTQERRQRHVVESAETAAGRGDAQGRSSGSRSGGITSIKPPWA
eukprot:gnl/TRDRNA2_/TRDRNA2_175619_c0_seq3.p1 gnl/TRDRNA2_/TRDRNA2_175619_c0~~gnl/TRDRNA2_/TRDRNA2_175619_c0_seq3.p1  ORF type:complete len:536 (-),score=92.89 gnl/TRDRNA2_/TRDRNA2_175619_c0_seq3:280-1887(-)